MRRAHLGIVLASLALLAGLVVSPIAQQSAAAAAYGEDLKVEPTPYCEPGDEYLPCVTDMTADLGLAYTNESTSIEARLLDLRTSAGIPIEYDNYPYDDLLMDVPISTKDTALPAGDYELRVNVSTPGKWECSEYFEDGCIWFDDENATLRWRFLYDGTSRSTFERYQAPATDVRKGWILKRGARLRLATGKVVGTIERSDHTLTGSRPIAGRKVTLKRKAPGTRWKTVDVGKTNRKGEYRLKSRIPADARFGWLIIVSSAPGSPGTTAQTDGKFRAAARNTLTS